MAVTSIWPIKGRADHVLDYARNPEKTTQASYEAQAALHTIDGVMEYAADEVKTEQRSYVSCLNCREDMAAVQFMETKRLWGKLDGRVCYHGYQSFRADEVMAETAHKIGIQLAQELWGDRFEVLIATHCNTGHYHNHFVINSVSFLDGYKFYNSPADYAKMREVSDRLCRAYELSVIEQPRGKGKHYAEWQAEKNGKPTLKGVIRSDIDRAILASTTECNFIHVMQEMGYELKTRGKGGQPLKYPALKPPGADGYFRFHNLGEGYDLEEVRARILQNIRKQVPFPEVEQKPHRRYRIHKRPVQKITGLRALYFRYCYELHILVRRPTSVKRVSFSLREDLAKLDRLDRETLFLGKKRISTIGELAACRERAAAEIEDLSAKRQELRNDLRRLLRQGNRPDTDMVKAKIARISSRLKKLRKEAALCDGIAERSGLVKTGLEQLLEQKNIEREEVTQNELFRRCGRTGRAHDIGGR